MLKNIINEFQIKIFENIKSLKTINKIFNLDQNKSIHLLVLINIIPYS